MLALQLIWPFDLGQGVVEALGNFSLNELSW